MGAKGCIIPIGKRDVRGRIGPRHHIRSSRRIRIVRKHSINFDPNFPDGSTSWNQSGKRRTVDPSVGIKPEIVRAFDLDLPRAARTRGCSYQVIGEVIVVNYDLSISSKVDKNRTEEYEQN